MCSIYNEEVLRKHLDPNRFRHLDITEQRSSAEKQCGKNELTGQEAKNTGCKKQSGGDVFIQIA